MHPVKVLIADDHPLIRQGLVKIIGIDPAIKVVGEAVDGEDVINKTEEYNPDIIIMDLNMPKLDGLEAARIIKNKQPNIKVIVLTVEDSEHKVIEMIRTGVCGYLLKDIDPEALASTIKAVYAGETVINPKITSLLFKKFERVADYAGCGFGAQNNEKIDLTPREAQVLKYITKGIHNKEIASQLFISEKTVKNHISSIFRKLQVDDRTQAALSAIKLKLVNF